MVGRVRRNWISSLFLLPLLLGISQPLWAHAILMDSSPKLNSTVKGPDVAITLRYNVRIDGSRSRVQLAEPDGSTVNLSLEKQTKPDVLQCKATGLKPGVYTLKWNVLASDGHMSKGEVPFTVS